MSEKESLNKYTALVFGLVAIVFCVYAGMLLWFVLPIDSYTVAQSGVFGDSFGLLTALFSGLAFAGLLVSIQYQRKDLGLTKQELSDTRAELQKQHLEKTFFQLVTLYSDIVNGLDVKTQKESHIDVATGRDSFDRLYDKLKKRYTAGDEVTPDAAKMLIQKAYDDFWDSWQKDLGHYFRHLYTLYKYIETSDLQNKKFYSNIIRAQLSDFELLLLFYNCLTTYGEKFKPLAEHYELFDNMPSNLVFANSHIALYDKSAYGQNEKALSIYSQYA